MLISVLFVCLLSFAGANSADQAPFKPLTYGLNFKVYFRVQAFANEQPIYSGDIYESYHSQLGACLIKQTCRGLKTGLPISKRFLCDSRAGRLVEFTEQQHEGKRKSSSELDVAKPFLDNDFHLYENGGSTSYRPDKLQQEFRNNTVRLVPEGATIDSQLLMGHEQEDSTVASLNLDQFMTPECLEELLPSGQFHYVNGLTRLLHLIECRRGEFKLQQASRQRVELTRGQTRHVYRAKKLEATRLDSTDMKAIRSIDLLVTVHKTSGSPANTLAPGAIPLSIVITCEPALSILINLYQFESVGPDDHLSESASGHSTYLMPLAQPNLSHLLASIQDDNSERKEPKATFRQAKSFSFEATLTGSHLSQFYKIPNGLSVSYDAHLGALAAWSTYTECTQSDGLACSARRTIRWLHDSSSGLKFHLMESNFGYVSHGDEEQQGQVADEDDIKPARWRACATDKLTGAEITELQEGSDGYLFQLAGATYMGEALVRGIRCQVYERRLFQLPALLGVSENDYVHLGTHLAQSKLYLNLYAYGNELPGADNPRFARLDVRIVSRADEAQQRSYTLEISGFEWRASGVQSDGDLFRGENLLARLSQECLLMVPGARHLDMELWFGLTESDDGGRGKVEAQSSSSRANKMLLARLASDREARDQSVREMLAKSALGLSTIQQVDLVSEMQLPDDQVTDRLVADVKFDHHNQILYARFSLYELWADFAQTKHIGYARSLTLSSRNQLAGGAHSAGALSYSYSECKWRALHSLSPDRKRSELNRRDDDEREWGDSRLFMFCPARLLCLLGDASWTPMRRQERLTLDNVLEYPYVAPELDDDNKSSEQIGEDENKCVVAWVIIKQQVGSVGRKTGIAQPTPGRPQLDWWLINGASGLGRSRDSLALQEVRELRLELKVKESFAHETTQATALGVKVNKLKLSNRVFTSSSNSNENNQSWNDVSLLMKPLAGLAYLPAGRARGEPGTRPVPGAIISSQPLVVASLAECSRACLNSHECQSFSACHEQQRENGTARHSVSCLLSRLSWSSQVEFQKLVRLAHSNTASETPLTLEVTSRSSEDEEGNDRREEAPMLQVYLRRSRLCSIRTRAQMDLFRMVKSHLDYVPGPKYLIPARSPDNCARMCQERAQLMRELSQANSGFTSSAREPIRTLGSSFRSAACQEFRFSSDGSYCQLLPLQDHWALLGLGHLLLNEREKGGASNRQQQPQPQPPASWLAAAKEKRSTLPTLNRWLRWFSGYQKQLEWLVQLSVQSLGEADHYELDFEEIFLAQRNRRLALVANTGAGQDQADWLQERLAHYSLYACAKRCIQLKGCRSFDVELPATRGRQGSASRSCGLMTGVRQDANVCQLNVISAADLSANPSAWPSFELERQVGVNSSTTEWWHYEPSELALFMISDSEQAGG